MIRPFCEDKHFTAAVHFRFGCKTLKNHFDITFYDLAARNVCLHAIT